MNKDLLGNRPLLFTLFMVCCGLLNFLSAQAVDIYVEDIQAELSGSVSVNVRANNFTGIGGAQFSLNWDAEELSFTGLDNLALNASESSSFNQTMVEQGKIGYIIADMSLNGFDLEDESILFTLNFNVLIQNDSRTIIQFSDDPVSQVVADTATNALEAVFQDGMVTVGNPVGTEENYVDDPRFTASPNPFFDELTINHQANRPGRALLRVMDVEGRVVLNRQQDLNLGDNRLRLGADDFPTPGVYVLRLETKEGNYQRKLVFSGSRR